MKEKKARTGWNGEKTTILIGLLACVAVVIAGFFYMSAKADALKQQKIGVLQKATGYYEERCLPIISKAADESGFSDLNIRVDFEEKTLNASWVKNQGYRVVCTVTITSEEIDAFAKVKDLTNEAAVLAGRLKHLNEGLYQGFQKLRQGVTGYGDAQVTIQIEGDYLYTYEGKTLKWDRYEYESTVHSERHTYYFKQHFWDNEDDYMKIDDRWIGFQYYG